MCNNVQPARPSCSTSGGHLEGAFLGIVDAVIPVVAPKKSRNELHERHLWGVSEGLW